MSFINHIILGDSKVDTYLMFIYIIKYGRGVIESLSPYTCEDPKILNKIESHATENYVACLQILCKIGVVEH